jgi:DNA-binding transcriptional regulator YiaG
MTMSQVTHHLTELKKSVDLVRRIGRQIKSIRKSTGLSQAEFAKKLGVSQKCVSLWEAGTRTPKASTLSKLQRLCEQTSSVA